METVTLSPAAFGPPPLLIAVHTLYANDSRDTKCACMGIARVDYTCHAHRLLLGQTVLQRRRSMGTRSFVWQESRVG